MMRWIVARVVAGSLAATIPAPASAAPANERPIAAPPAPDPPVDAAPAAESVTQGRWYGWELILSDVVFLAIASDGSQQTGSGLGSAELPIGLLGLALAPPAIHYGHGNPRRAVVGALVRGVTVGLWSLAISENNKTGPSCDGEGHCPGLLDTDELVVFGLAAASLIGAVGFVLIDDFFFSRAHVAPAPQPSLTLAPTLFLRTDGGVVGMAGRF